MQQVPAAPQVLAGKYRLVRQLGAGGMGTVWLADHLTLHCPVAIKLIDPDVASDSRFRARFMHEARAAAALRSPHVVQILDYGVDGATPYIAMELLEGESLADRLQRTGPLSPPDTARLMTQVGRALSRAEEAGIVHRDLKPANIFLVHNDEEELAKVLDFGIAKHTAPAGSGTGLPPTTESGALWGTRSYMSPEQAGGAKVVDARSDVWALGLIAFECLLGERAYHGETIGEFLEALFGRPPPVPSERGPVPAGFDAWFARACAYAAAERFPSAREACAELRKVCRADAVGEGASPRPGQEVGPIERAGEPPTLVATSPPSRAESARAPAAPARRARVVLGAAVIAAAVIGAVAVGSALRARGQPPTLPPPAPTRAPPAPAMAQPSPPATAQPSPPQPPPPATTTAPPAKVSPAKPTTGKRPGKTIHRKPGASPSPAPPGNENADINLGI
ncbi:MAG TPA: serine/threonine-protein kinase [Polyangia bacterium]|nr:serine/threonine-protein kinase [Polyangia bacterium]